MEAAQLKAQENKPEDSKALAELLNKQKVGLEFTSSLSDKDSTYCMWVYKYIFKSLFQVLVAEIEQKQSRIDECQKYSEQYSSAIKVS